MTCSGRGMFFKDWDNFRKALSCIHILKDKYKVWDDLKVWLNKHTDFIGTEMDATTVVATMHAVCLLITGNMGKYYHTFEISVMLTHALRHCVRDSVTMTMIVGTKHFSK